MDSPTLDTLLSRKSEIEGIVSRIDVWLLVFGLFVVVGVGGESVFGIRAWWNNRKLQSVQRDIENERDRLSKIEVEKLHESNLLLQREVLNLREKLADRHLTPEQQRHIAAAVHEFKGQTFSIITYPEEPEPKGLVADIRASLVEWTEEPISAKLAEGLVVGVQIELAPSRSKDFEPVAKALALALKNNGVFAFERVNPSFEKFPIADRVMISVGKKPTETDPEKQIPPLPKVP